MINRALFVLVLAAAACSDFATPAELEKPQVLGLRIESATIASGQPSRLSALVAGPSGPMEVQPQWSVSGPAVIATDESGALLVTEGEAPAVLELTAAFDVDGELLLARRSVRVEETASSNPVIDAIGVGGSPVTDGVRGQLGDIVALSVSSALEIGPNAGSVSWYSTLGEIDRYHRPEAELELTESGSGWLIVVCRDGLGGISWALQPLLVDEQ